MTKIGDAIESDWRYVMCAMCGQPLAASIHVDTPEKPAHHEYVSPEDESEKSK